MCHPVIGERIKLIQILLSRATEFRNFSDWFQTDLTYFKCHLGTYITHEVFKRLSLILLFVFCLVEAFSTTAAEVIFKTRK